MGIIQRQEQIDNRWLTWVVKEDNNCVLLETENQLTEEEAAIELQNMYVVEENGTTK